MNDHDKRRIRSLVDDRDVEGLIVALTDRNMDVRRTAAEALGDIGDERAVEPLIVALNDTTDYPVFKVPLQVPCTHIDARGEAALALGKIGGNAAVEALLAVADTNPEKGFYRGLSVVGAVKKALTELGVDAGEVTVPQDPTESPERKSSEEMVKTADDLRWGGKLDEAMEWAVRATETDPSNGYAWMQTGLIAVDRRDVEAATSAFVKAVSVMPGLKGSEPGARLAVVYDVLGMGEELNEVRSSLDRAGLRLDPRAEREWEVLVAAVDPGKLRAALGLETSEGIVEAEAEAEDGPVAGVCDICNAPGMGTIVSADQMREAVFQRGFNPFKMGLVMSPMISIVGEQEAYQHWKNTIVAQDTSDWNVCADCMPKLQPYLPDVPKATGVGESTVSFHPAVSAAAGAAAEKKYQMVTDAATPPAPARQTYKIVTDPAVPPARRTTPPAQASAPPAQAAVPKARPAAKESEKKRRLPVWAIVLLALGAVVLVGALVAIARPLLTPSKGPVVVDVVVTKIVTGQPAGVEPTVPAAAPSPTPTEPPSPASTAVPTESPVPTANPMAKPTPVPTEPPVPTAKPTAEPTAVPTEPPAPTAKPTAKPTSVPTEPPLPPPTPTRDFSTLETTLLGHWVTESGVTHFYIGPGTMIMVEPSGIMHLTWTRFEGNDEDNWMKIYVHRPDTGGGHYKLLRFAPDRMSLVSETNIAQKWLYVDSRQQP